MGAEQTRDEPAADPRAWRPQTAYRGRFRPRIDDPILEPLWNGTRVLAHYAETADASEWGTLEVRDAHGEDAAEVAPRALDALRRSIVATEAVLDGIMTDQIDAASERAEPRLDAPFSLRRLVRRERSGAGVPHHLARDEAREVGFVALDLLSIDGQPLLHVPLLERRRLLESAIAQSQLVRLTPWARLPMRRWFATWRAAGFRGMVVKGANSRYVPGKESFEWTILDRMP
jgi:ATP-dependent DNA ligase